MRNKILFILKNPFRLLSILIIRLKYFDSIRFNKEYQNKISFRIWLMHIFTRGSSTLYWPVNKSSQVYDFENIYAGVDTFPGFMKGCYIQGKGGIYIGDYTQIAPNVVIVSANHDVYDTRYHKPKSVIIGSYSWIGAGAKILPGVILGPHTIVGAGSIVTKSFEEGHCLIAGNPARKVKEYERKKFNKYVYKKRFFGFITEDQMKKLMKNNHKMLQIYQEGLKYDGSNN